MLNKAMFHRNLKNVCVRTSCDSVIVFGLVVLRRIHAHIISDYFAEEYVELFRFNNGEPFGCKQGSKLMPGFDFPVNQDAKPQSTTVDEKQ